MAMAALWLAPLDGEDVEPQRLEALIQRQIQLTDQVQHIRVRAGPAGCVLFGFIMAGSSAEAREALQEITQRALVNEPELLTWRVI